MEGTNGFTAVNPSTAPTLGSTAPTPSAPLAGTKRKRSDKANQLKFYAVRIGKDPGIYHSWAECLEQVRGFPKAHFKSFTSLTDAQNFVDHAEGEGGGKGGSGKFYGVKEGRVPGVYNSWPEVLEQITGWKGPKHKAFKTRAEAELFVSEGRNGSATQQSGALLTNGDHPLDSTEPSDAPPKKAAKTSKKVKSEPTTHIYDDDSREYDAGDGPLPPDASDNFDPTITLDQTTGTARYKTASELGKTKYQAIGPAPSAPPIRIYTDGSALSNGNASASHGGVGVYFGPKDRRNISEPLTGSKQTNQRAELTAILRALEVAPRDIRVAICTDSDYAIKCVTQWFIKWRSNNWHNASGKPVENKDLVLKVIDMLEERVRLNRHRQVYEPESLTEDGEERQYWEHGPASVKFVWVKGHAKDEGNNAADALAVNGARVARELGEDVVLD